MTMLTASRYHRAEVRNNVTAEFPNLGLHSASSSGDIGLVKYALSHGQSVNSILDGVFPLHAACAGGNDLVVNLLIEHGADVNAARLSRRYSDCNRDGTAFIVGTSGSTPLHFAAANGHLTVIHTLILHGAIPNRADKHGVTPEQIARENGWIECAEVLAQYTALSRERERAARGVRAQESNSTSKERTGARCPIDHLEAKLRKRLHIKRSVDHGLGELKSGTATSESDRQHQQPSMLHYSLSDQEIALNPESGEIPPFSPPLALPESSGRRPSLPHIFDEPPPRPFLSSRTHRPRSAGAGAEQVPPRKLHSKLSLLSLFKKSIQDGYTSNVISTPEQRTRSSPSQLPLPSTSSPMLRPTAQLVSPRSIPIPLSSPCDTSHFEYQRHRFEGTTSSPSSRSYPIEPHDSLVLEGPHRPAPAASPGDHQSDGDSATDAPRPRGRASILGMHDRSVSSGHGSASQHASLSQAIRFERSTSSMSSLASRTRSPRSHGIQSNNRLHAQSIGSGDQHNEDYDGIPDTIEESPVIAPQPAPPILVDRADYNDEELEEEYGVPITRSSERHTDLQPSRGHLLPASSHLPFNINVPPPIDDVNALSAPLSDPLLETRLRGDSVSSASTTVTISTYTQSSSSDATWSVATPNTPQVFPDPLVSTNSVKTKGEGGVVHDVTKGTKAHDFPSRRAHVPPHIDISSISSHAQAEALVQLTQQSILDMEQYLDRHVQKDTETGRTPLSAKLAAYGESLAIERRLKEQMSEKARAAQDESTGEYAPPSDGSRQPLLWASKPTEGGGYVPRRSSDSRSSSENTFLEHGQAYEHARRTRSVSDDIRHARPSCDYHSPPPPPSKATTTHDLFRHTPPRSRTPDGNVDSTYVTRGIAPPLPLSRVSSTPSYDLMHSHASTTSAAPFSVSTIMSPSFTSPSSSLSMRRPHHHHARDRDTTRSTQKLARMGFLTMDAWRHSSSPLKNGTGQGRRQ